jgi:hypothetical protein
MRATIHPVGAQLFARKIGAEESHGVCVFEVLSLDGIVVVEIVCDGKMLQCWGQRGRESGMAVCVDALYAEEDR